jgi:hypothetical protein
MEVVLLLARLLLAVVFIISGLAKLADLEGSRQAMVDFGLPAPFARFGGRMLPLLELVLALALLPTVSAWWGALGILVLLAVFVTGISFNLARGRKPDCHCFGQLSSKPIGWTTLVRNGLLMAVAGFILWQGPDQVGPSAIGWLGELTTAERVGLVGAIIAFALLGAMLWFMTQLLAQNGRMLLRLEALEARLADPDRPIAPPAASAPSTAPVMQGLAVGSRAPAFSLAGLHGEVITLDALRAPGKRIMLIFSDPQCGPCNTLLPDIGRWQREYD